MRVPVQGSSRYEPYGISFPQRGSVYVRWYQRACGVPDGNLKGLRFHAAPAGPNAGYMSAQGPMWGFDDGKASTVSTGMAWGVNCEGVACTCRNLADGKWHSIEIQYERANGRARFWCDGRAVKLPAGASVWYGGAYPELQYTAATDGGPTWIAGGGKGQLGSVTWYEMLSSTTREAIVWIDDIAASTKRIGP
jgi:hypothetical protein